MNGLLKDLRFALRVLTRSPGFTAIAVLTVGLGVGANTAMFSIIDTVLIRPLPFEDADRLSFVWGVEGGQKSGSNWNSYPDVLEFQEQNRVFTDMATLSFASPTVSADGLAPTRVSTSRISDRLFPLLGVAPALGRHISPEENTLAGERVALLGDGLWRDSFGADPGIIGRIVNVDGLGHTVIGVMPPAFQFPEGVRLWVPMAHEHAEDDRGTHRLLTLARLKPGVDVEQATDDMAAIARIQEEKYPDTNTKRSARVESLQEALVGDVRASLFMLFGAVGVVLLIVCANVANLLLARASSRRQEVAVRTSLGASRYRLVRLLLTESCVLALFGGALGILIASWGLDLLVSRIPATVPRLSEVAINGRVLTFSLGVTLLTGIFFGLVPATQSWKRDLVGALKGGGSLQRGGKIRMRQVLVISEVALSFVLVVGAFLLTASLIQISRIEPGFSADHVLTVPLALPTSEYEYAQAVAFYDRLLERIEVLPGVRSAAAAYQHPLSGGWETSFFIPGRLEPAKGERPEARIRPVTPGYFQTVGMPLLAGRDFTDRDDGDGAGVVIINESFARDFFPEGDALGQSLERNQWWDDLPGSFEIVGVVGDVKMDGLTATTPWAMYYPHPQVPFNDMFVFVRSAVDPVSLTGVIRDAVWELDANLPVENVRTLEQIRIAGTTSERFQVTLISLFAAVALGLAAIGTYGVQSSLVVQRTGEIGLRMALGANTSGLLRTILGQGLRLTLVGIGVGLIAALLGMRLISSLLFGVSATDPATFMLVLGLFVATAALACVVPAARAMRIDPMRVLRSE